jgi:ElaB/YqjD/DUF883 family membrane-anchored ribosome-binding protein
MAQHNGSYPLDYTPGPDRAAADTAANQAKERLREMADGATEQLKRVADNAGEIAGRAAEQARIYGEKAHEVAKNFKPYVEKSIKEKPMATLAVAAAIAFALGALWKKS